MAIEDPMVMPLAIELLDCLNEQIQQVAKPPKFVQLRTGDIVAHLMSTTEDECCSGLAWVRPVTFYPTSQFPQQADRLTQKGVEAWAVTLEMGAVRCAPTPGADRIPTAEEWMAVTQAVMDDAAAMRRALCCWIDSGPPGTAGVRAGQILPGQWQPLPLEGGCVGGTLPVTIRRPACDC